MARRLASGTCCPIVVVASDAVDWTSVRKAVLLVCMLSGCGRLGFGESATNVDGSLGSSDGDVGGSNSDAAADGAPGMVQLGQTSPVVDAQGGQTATLPTPSSPGSLLVMTFGANSVSSLELPAGWMIATSVSTTGACSAAIAYLPNNPGGITEVTYVQPQLLPTVAHLTEWAGIATNSPLDAIGTTSAQVSDSSQTVQTATATTASNTLAIDVFCEAINNPTYTGDPAWIGLGTVTNGPSEASFLSEYRVVAAPGVVSTTVTSSNPGKYSAAVATFRPQ